MARRANKAAKKTGNSGGGGLKTPFGRGAFLVVAVLIILFLLSLFGSATNPLYHLYLIKLKGTNATQNEFEDLQVRIGYFGMCAGTLTNTTCALTPSQSNETLPNLFNATVGPAFTQLLTFSLELQTTVFLYFMAIAFGLFFFSIIFLLLFSRHPRSVPSVAASRRRQNDGLRTLVFGLGSFAFALTSVVSMSQVGATVGKFAATLDDSVIEVNAGVGMEVVEWLIVCFLVFYVYVVMEMFEPEVWWLKSWIMPVRKYA